MSKRILITFGGTLAEWVFTSQAENETFVTITNSGFQGEDIVKQALDSTEG